MPVHIDSMLSLEEAVKIMRVVKKFSLFKKNLDAGFWRDQRLPRQT